ncbi:hypothetical protein ABTX62_36455 [Streptomyces sp. NPDC096046]|uniref:hypothetical protein n=1 Tax=Streptomyces sp. NPDC096046 TaxID=3155542 RepID=UPI00331D2E63
MIFIDYQPEMLDWIKSIGTKRMMVNAGALARLAVKMGINQPTLPELRAEICTPTRARASAS